jgi:hypothetical protein
MNESENNNFGIFFIFLLYFLFVIFLFLLYFFSFLFYKLPKYLAAPPIGPFQVEPNE